VALRDDRAERVVVDVQFDGDVDRILNAHADHPAERPLLSVSPGKGVCTQWAGTNCILRDRDVSLVEVRIIVDVELIEVLPTPALETLPRRRGVVVFADRFDSRVRAPASKVALDGLAGREVRRITVTPSDKWIATRSTSRPSRRDNPRQR